MTPIERESRDPAPQKRLTIGLLALAINDDVNGPRWQGMIEEARHQQVNIISMHGGLLSSQAEQTRSLENLLYDLLRPERWDGMIVGSIINDHLTTSDEIQAFHQCLPTHVVSIRPTLPHIPYIPMDNYQGMRAAIIHLIEVHQRRRIAFLRGPAGHPYAEERYQAYVDILQEYGLPDDPQLVTPPSDWAAPSLPILLDERQLRPGVDFDAVVAVSDVRKGFDTLRILAERGVRVPHEVAVVSFDNIRASRTQIPPLTSVRVPFSEQGQQAVNILLAQVFGEHSPSVTAIPAQIVLRQSCGCLSNTITFARADSAPDIPKALMRDGEIDHDTIIAAMLTAFGHSSAQAYTWMEQILSGFLADIADPASGALLDVYRDILMQTMHTAYETANWNNVVSALRLQILPCLTSGTQTSRAEALWGQIRVLIGEHLAWIEQVHHHQEQEYTQKVRDLERQLSSSFHLPNLLDVLARSLPGLGIPSCYLAVYDPLPEPVAFPHAPAWARLILAYTPRGRVALEPGGRRFPAHQFVPSDLLPAEYQFHVEALFFEEQALGFIVFAISQYDWQMYDSLRFQISSALQGALLVEREIAQAVEIVRQKYVLDTFMANVPDSIYFKDRDSRFTQINQSLARILDLAQPDEALGKSDFDFYSEEEARLRCDQEQTIMRTGRPLLAQEERDPGNRWTLTTKMPLRDEHGDIIGTFGISRDITDIKHAQEEIQPHAHELAAAYEEINILNAQLEQENLRMGSELNVARQIQTMILPKPEELRQIEGIDIVGYMQPTEEVGGDYYDVLNERGIVHVGIGDVTGHGLESGVVMLMTQTAIRTLIEHGETDPVKFVTTLNRTIYKNIQRMGAEKALTLALINYVNGQVKLVGQHEELLVVRKGGAIERVDTVDLGFPLGLEQDIAKWVATVTIALVSGDGVVLYTDGITEAANKDDELYGLERLCEVISRNWENSAESIKQAVIHDVTRHIGMQKVYDDITLVVLKQN